MNRGFFWWTGVVFWAVLVVGGIFALGRWTAPAQPCAPQVVVQAPPVVPPTPAPAVVTVATPAPPPTPAAVTATIVVETATEFTTLPPPQ